MSVKERIARRVALEQGDRVEIFRLVIPCGQRLTLAHPRGFEMQIIYGA